MKKLVPAAFFCALATVVHAQLILGGQLTFGFATDKSDYKFGSEDETRTTLISVLPRLAHDVGKNLWIGGDIGITYVTTSNDAWTTYKKKKTTLISVGPFVRHIWKPVDRMGVLLEGKAGINVGDSKEDQTQTDVFFGFDAGIRPGVIFFIGDHISFEALVGRLGFSSFRNTELDKSDTKVTVNQFGFTLNNNLNGLSYLLDDKFSFGGILFGVNYRF